MEKGQGRSIYRCHMQDVDGVIAEAERRNRPLNWMADT